MELEQQLDQIIRKEKQKPIFSHHHINSYLTNLPVDSNNDELMNILHYFDSDKDFLCLYQDKEFKNGLTIEVKCEMIMICSMASIIERVFITIMIFLKLYLFIRDNAKR